MVVDRELVCVFTMWMLGVVGKGASGKRSDDLFCSAAFGSLGQIKQPL